VLFGYFLDRWLQVAADVLITGVDAMETIGAFFGCLQYDIQVR
jgi:hypothetical protein